MTTGLQLDTNQIELQSPQELQKLVKLFWGPEPLSFLRFLTIKSLCVLNPEWRIQLSRAKASLAGKPWTDINRQDFEAYKGRDYWNWLDFPNLEIVELEGYPDICSSHQSNFFKWNNLGKGNCVYSDMDILYVKPLDEIYNSLNSCTITVNHNGKYFSHGFMSAKGVNAFFNDLHNCLISDFDQGSYEGAGSDIIYKHLGKSMSKGLEHLKSRYPGITVWNFQDKVFYPWSYNNIEDYFKFNHEVLPVVCVGLHWYGGSSLSQEANNKITPETIHTLNNTVCYHGRQFCQ